MCATLATQGVDLLFHSLVVNVDVIIVYGSVAVYLDAHCGSESKIKLKLEVVGLGKVAHLVAFVNHGFTQHLEILILYIVVYSIAQHFLQFFSLGFVAIHLLHQAHRHHSLAETRHLCSLLNLFQ